MSVLQIEESAVTTHGLLVMPVVVSKQVVMELTMYSRQQKIMVDAQAASTPLPTLQGSQSEQDAEYERHVLTTPGVAEGFDEAYQLIEEWKRSL